MANDQGRAPPAYQEFAATMLASRNFRLANATARGILYTMRLELWVNESLPAEPRALSIILGLDSNEVVAAMPALMSFFAVENGEIRSPELDGYRAHLEARRLKLSAGGKAGAAATNGGKRESRGPKGRSRHGAPVDAATPSATLTGTPFGTPPPLTRPLSTVKPSTTKSKPVSIKDLALDPWVADYIAAESHVQASAEAYRKASGGE